MLESLISNLELIGILIVMLAGTTAANILFGLYDNIELKNEVFSRDKLLGGLKKFGVVALGSACLVVVFALLPSVLELWKVDIDPAVIEGISAAVIVAVYVVAIASSGADALGKLRDILKIGKTEG